MRTDPGRERGRLPRRSPSPRLWLHSTVTATESLAREFPSDPPPTCLDPERKGCLTPTRLVPTPAAFVDPASGPPPSNGSDDPLDPRGGIGDPCLTCHTCAVWADTIPSPRHLANRAAAAITRVSRRTFASRFYTRRRSSAITDPNPIGSSAARYSFPSSPFTRRLRYRSRRSFGRYSHRRVAAPHARRVLQAERLPRLAPDVSTTRPANRFERAAGHVVFTCPNSEDPVSRPGIRPRTRWHTGQPRPESPALSRPGRTGRRSTARTRRG